jgi:ATP-dependent Clp protease ATP-binding subunit ClpX
VLTFTDEALEHIAVKAKEAGTGARALRMIVENKLIDLMYEVPSDEDITEIIIDKTCMEGTTDPIIQRIPKEKTS